MSRERALALQRRGLHDWVALLGRRSEGAQTWERDGVTASIVPSCPRPLDLQLGRLRGRGCARGGARRAR